MFSSSCLLLLYCKGPVYYRLLNIGYCYNLIIVIKNARSQSISIFFRCFLKCSIFLIYLSQYLSPLYHHTHTLTHTHLHTHLHTHTYTHTHKQVSLCLLYKFLLSVARNLKWSFLAIFPQSPKINIFELKVTKKNILNTAKFLANFFF